MCSSDLNVIRALDATTGALLWQYDPEVGAHIGNKRQVGWAHNRGISFYKGKIFGATWDGRLFAVDAKSGELAWSTRSYDADKPLYITGAPKAFRDKVLIGNGGTEVGRARGFVTAFDAETGEEAWKFFIVPGNPADGFENETMAMAAETWTGPWWEHGGGGNAWHTAGNFAYMAILAALVYRDRSGEGQHIDASVHDSIAVTTEMHIPNYLYHGKVVIRQTGRHHSANATPPTQFRCRDGKYVNAILWGMTPSNLRRLAEWMAEHDLADDLLDERYADAAFMRQHHGHVVDVTARFIANMTADEIYHGGQERGFTWSAVRAPDELLGDPHLADREFWTEVAHPDLGRSYTYPGPVAIYNGSPWRISRRAPLVGEHNEEVLQALGVLAEDIPGACGLENPGGPLR